MIEHPVEITFKEHAKNFQCEEFEISRRDGPDLGFFHKFTTGVPDVELHGRYLWDGRLFRFEARVHTDGFVGSVFVQSYLHKPLLIQSLDVACSLNERFPGYSTIIHRTDIPSIRDLGHFFWGIGTRVYDLNFTDLSVNAITASLDADLQRFEKSLASGTK
jgi:hypothetical protein